RTGVRADQFDAVLFEDAPIVELERDVQRGLPTHRGEERVRPLPGDDPFDPLRCDRLYVGAVREVGIRHDRGRVAVDQNDPVALLLEGAYRLRSRIVELAGLPNHDRARTDEENRLQIVASRHEPVIPSTPFLVPSGWPWPGSARSRPR